VGKATELGDNVRNVAQAALDFECCQLNVRQRFVIVIGAFTVVDGRSCVFKLLVMVSVLDEKM
jgi:hypothetical protein